MRMKQSKNILNFALYSLLYGTLSASQISDPLDYLTVNTEITLISLPSEFTPNTEKPLTSNTSGNVTESSRPSLIPLLMRKEMSTNASPSFVNNEAPTPSLPTSHATSGSDPSETIPRVLDFTLIPIIGSNPPLNTVTLTHTSRPDQLYAIQQAQSGVITFVLDNTNNYTVSITPNVTVSQPDFLNSPSSSARIIFTGATAALGTSDLADFSGAIFTGIGGGLANTPGGNFPRDFVTNNVAYTLRDDTTDDLYTIRHTFFRAPQGSNSAGTGTVPTPDNNAGLVIEVIPPTNRATSFEFINLPSTSSEVNSSITTTSANFNNVPSAFFRVIELEPTS